MNDKYGAILDAMIEETLCTRGIHDEAIFDAMRRMPRHRFLPLEALPVAYDDHAVSIGFGQTASQPYVVAWMLQLACIRPGHRVLEVGVGSGWAAALCAAMGATVFGIERHGALASRARASLAAAGADVTVKHADGYLGWPEHAPFDAILVSAAPPSVPPALVQQLGTAGRLVLPVGDSHTQSLLLVTKSSSNDQGAVRFVPMTPGVEP